METNRLEGNVAVITGAARGQGEAEARLFASEGARVVLTDVLEDQLAAVGADLGDAARWRRHDVSSEADWAVVMDFVQSEFGRLDVLVNNAAIHHVVPIEEETLERFERVCAVNLIGTFLGVRSAIAPLRASGGGSIVNISSLAGVQGFFGHGSYGAAKAGVTNLTKVAALELGPSGIRVNSVHPGPIDTDMLPGGNRPGRFSDLPLGRCGSADEVADLVLFLASDASSYITGTEVRIDGGTSVGRVPNPANRRS